MQVSLTDYNVFEKMVHGTILKRKSMQRHTQLSMTLKPDSSQKRKHPKAILFQRRFTGRQFPVSRILPKTPILLQNICSTGMNTT